MSILDTTNQLHKSSSIVGKVVCEIIMTHSCTYVWRDPRFCQWTVSGKSKIKDSSMNYFIKAPFNQRNISSFVLTEKDNNMRIFLQDSL